MSTIITVPNVTFNDETRDVSIAINNNSIAAYNRAAAIGNDFMQRHAGDAIDEAIIDEICAVFDITDADSRNIDFSSEFEDLFHYIYTQI